MLTIDSYAIFDHITLCSAGYGMMSTELLREFWTQIDLLFVYYY